jgi:D-tyrosyl-tRNA(Tyr) deacylase
MRIIIQRVRQASVTVNGQTIGAIKAGLLIFLGVAKDDQASDADYLVKKVVELRLFEDKDGKMNLASADVGAEFLVVSQFTLYGNCDKGRRPSFDEAAAPAKGEELYSHFVSQLKKTGAVVATGQFRAMMDVALINDGPVTFIIDSRQKLSGMTI